MPDDFQYVKMPDGSYGKFNAGVSDDVIRQTIIKNFPDAYKSDQLTQQTQSAAKAAGVSTAPAPQPLATQMRAEGQKYESSLGPQARIEQVGTPEEKARLESGLEMRVPESLMSFGALGPIGGISRQGLGAYLNSVGRPLLKSAAGAIAGSGAGYALGKIGGPEMAQRGEEIGGIAGGLIGPMVPNRIWASAPYGMNRLFLSNEDIAAERTAMKLAQRSADVAAGLRKPIEQPPLGKISAETLGPESVAGTRPRSLVLTPEEAASEQQMQGIAKRRASERGMQFAAGMTPREGRPVPRFPNRMAPTEYPAPREITVFDEQGNPLGKIKQ